MCHSHAAECMLGEVAWRQTLMLSLVSHQLLSERKVQRVVSSNSSLGGFAEPVS